MSIKHLLGTSIVGIASSAMLASCSGNEDPRVTFCRSLAVNLTQSSSETTWRNDGYDVVRPEYASIKLSAGEQRVACFYAYDAVEESAFDHADELHAYATLPYKVTLNDQTIDQATLAAAIKTEQIAGAKAVVGNIQQGFNALLDKIKQLF